MDGGGSKKGNASGLEVIPKLFNASVGDAAGVCEYGQRRRQTETYDGWK